MAYKTLHIDRLSNMYSTINPEMKSGAAEELAIPAPLVTPVVTLVNNLVMIHEERMGL